MDRYAYYAEWKQQQPDEWVGYQREHSQRPADYQEQAPQ
jgi:hypothetical protein